MTVINRLRSAIAVSHDQIEKTPYSIAIMNASIGISDYIVSLAQLYAIHHTLESVSSHNQFAAYFSDEMIRTSAIKRDLKFWGASLADIAIMPEAAATCTLIEQAATKEPASILGFIYVLEGSRMGSLVIVKPLAAALQVTPHDSQGLDYHTEGARQTPARLGVWKARVEQIGLSESDVHTIERATTAFMESLTTLYAKLPVNENLRFNRIQADVA